MVSKNLLKTSLDCLMFFKGSYNEFARLDASAVFPKKASLSVSKALSK